MGSPCSSGDLQGGRPKFPLEDRLAGHLGWGHPVCVTHCWPGGCCCTGFSEPGCTHRWCQNPRPAWARGVPRTAALSGAETGSAAARAGRCVYGQSLLQPLHPCDVLGDLVAGVEASHGGLQMGSGCRPAARRGSQGCGPRAARRDGAPPRMPGSGGPAPRGTAGTPSPCQPHLQVFPHL